ncbi:hypothetical protein RB597_001235 [Gaeumannomyces tritici]
MPGTPSQEWGQQAARVYFPDRLSNEIIQMIIGSDCGLSNSDLKSLRCVCKRLDDAIIPVLFRTVVCSSLWRDRRNFLSIAGSARLSGSARTFRWLELSPMTPDIPNIDEEEERELAAYGDDLNVTGLELATALMKRPSNPVFWMPALDLDLTASLRANRDFITPFCKAILAMPCLTRVEVQTMPHDRVIWTSPSGFEFTPGNTAGVRSRYMRHSNKPDGGGGLYGILAISVIGRVAGTPGTGPPGIDPVLVWEENEYPVHDSEYARSLSQYPHRALKYVRELSLALTKGRVGNWWNALDDFSDHLQLAMHLQKLCLDWKAWHFTDEAAHKPMTRIMLMYGLVPISPCLKELTIKHYEQNSELPSLLAYVLIGHGGSIRTLRLENCKTTVEVMRKLFEEDVPRVEDLVVVEDGALVYRGESKGIPDFAGHIRFPFKLPPWDSFKIRDRTCHPFVSEEYCELLHHVIGDEGEEEDEEADQKVGEAGNGEGDGVEVDQDAEVGQPEDGEEAETITSLEQLTQGRRGSWDNDRRWGPWEPRGPWTGEAEEEGDANDPDVDEDDKSDVDEDDPAYRHLTAPHWACRPYKFGDYAGAIYCPVPKDNPLGYPTTIWMLTRRRGQTLIDEPILTWLEPDEHFEDWDESLGDEARPTPLGWQLAALACLAKGGEDRTAFAKQLLDLFHDGGVPDFPRLPLDPKYFPDPVVMDRSTRTSNFRLPSDPANGGYFSDETLLSVDDYRAACREWRRVSLEEWYPDTPWYQEP